MKAWFIKFFRSLFALGYMVLYFRVFNLKVFANKRVVIVGPADSAFNTGRGQYIDQFDYIIRVNRAPYIVDLNQYQQDIGTRTDILFHSFYENDESGGGPLNLELYDKQKLKYLVNPRHVPVGIRNTFNFYRKYLCPRKTFILPKKVYREICEPLERFVPTVGYTALLTVLASDFKEFYITGFSFYKTPFGKGYRDQIQSSEKALEFIHKIGQHNVELELKLFKDIMRKTKKNVVLDDTLHRIIFSEHERVMTQDKK